MRKKKGRKRGPPQADDPRQPSGRGLDQAQEPTQLYNPESNTGEHQQEPESRVPLREVPVEHNQFQTPSQQPSVVDEAQMSASSNVVLASDTSNEDGNPEIQTELCKAQRPGHGEHGRGIKLIANHLLLKCKDTKIYHYDIKFKYFQTRKIDSGHAPSNVAEGQAARGVAQANPSFVDDQIKKTLGKARCREIFSQMFHSARLKEYYPVFDGQRNVYTIKPIPIKQDESFEASLQEGDRLKMFEIFVQPVKRKNGTNIIYSEDLLAWYEGRNTEIPQEVVMVFDAVMNNRFLPLSQCNVGRSFFNLNQDPYKVGDGLEIWFGYNQSIHLTERGLAVILNFSAKAFHKSGRVIDYANEILGQDITEVQTLNHDQINLLKDRMEKIKIRETHSTTRRMYTIKSISIEAAEDLRLNVDGRHTTVSRYFQENYFQLRYPHLPCLYVQSTNKTTYLPFEVCEIMPNQPVLGKLDGKMTSNMIQQTTIPPAERFIEIENKINDIQKFSGEAMKKFQLVMDSHLCELDARVIPAPALAYRSADSGARVEPDSRGIWRMKGKHFVKSVSECSWALISFGNPMYCSEDHLRSFADTLCTCARGAGFQLEWPEDIRICDQHTRTFDELRRVKDMGVTFAVVVLSSRDRAHSYEEVKFLADIKLSLITQCMEEEVVAAEKPNPQVATNVLLKINSKVGGVNHSFAECPRILLSGPIIVFGAAAVHSPRGFSCPSIVSIVGSIDSLPSGYAVTCHAQKKEKKLCQEIIVDLKDMVKHILKCCKNSKGKCPEKVIVFRSGVCEGQFQTVLRREIPEFQKACDEALGYIPPLTFIVVQKRHRTRFRPKNPEDGIGKMGNVPPGTTVDTDVVHSAFFDFFICSHEGIKGTSKPARYTVLYDGNNFKPDDLQELCYHLCHMYVRCNRSISVPAPVMYAHLVCTRAKKYVDFYIKSGSVSVGSSNPSDDGSFSKTIEDIINDMGNFFPGMFYI